VRATLLYSVIFWCSFAGKFLFGAISDRLPKRRVMLIASLILFSGCLILFEPRADGLALTSSLPRLASFAAIFGLGFGGSFTMIQLVAVESFGQRSLGKILGFITLIDALGALGYQCVVHPPGAGQRLSCPARLRGSLSCAKYRPRSTCAGIVRTEPLREEKE
jgi:MFS family permease